MNIRSLRSAALVVVAAASLTGCDTIRNAAGMDKSAPDEFAVLTKAPLVIPPDYNLKPPRPGVLPTNQMEPTDAAQTALFGNDTAATATAAGTTSESETLLLSNAKVASADPAIRQHLASDRANMIGADDTFTNEVLFWQKPASDAGSPLDADQEARRLGEQRAGQGVAGGKPASSQPAPPPKQDKGWFDGWFDWF
jgi:hypothetical protein